MCGVPGDLDPHSQCVGGEGVGGTEEHRHDVMWARQSRYAIDKYLVQHQESYHQIG